MLRKLTLNTTGITHHRAIPMLTKVVELCNERNVIFDPRRSTASAMPRVGATFATLFEKAGKTIAAMQELQDPLLQLRISSTISKNLEDADNILAWG